MLHSIYLALLQFWAWANVNPIDPYDPLHPLCSPFQCFEILVVGSVGGVVFFALFHRFTEWQEKRWAKEFAMQRQLDQTFKSK